MAGAPHHLKTGRSSGRDQGIQDRRVMPDGKEQVICIFRSPDSFAEVTLTTIATYPADAVALESSQVILVKKQGFLELIRRDPTLSLRMLTSMSFHLKYLVQLIEDLKFKAVAGLER